MARKASRVACLLGAVLLIAVAGIGVGSWWQSHRDSSNSDVPLSAVDIGFTQDMSTHHQQAILLSQTLAPDVDPQVRSIADQIVTEQTAEIATMHGWLSLFDLPYSSPHPMQWMHSDNSMHGDMSGMSMPGMASIDEIGRLGQLHGRAAEVLYLQLMIRHHQGGIEMARTANNLGLRSQIDRVAVGMVAAQGNEVGVMTTMLDARGAHPLPFP